MATSVVLIAGLSPILCITGILVRCFLGKPILFSQIRPGLNSELFTVFKFRTMTNERNSGGVFLDDRTRLTSFGKFLRKTSLDELPSLWNVLIGQMSLVGPRPLLPEYLPLYSTLQSRRHIVNPGITGWAQINGRNSLTWQEKFELDIWYVENQSFLLDVRILFLTILKTIKRQDITSENEATMYKFAGNGDD